MCADSNQRGRSGSAARYLTSLFFWNGQTAWLNVSSRFSFS